MNGVSEPDRGTSSTQRRLAEVERQVERLVRLVVFLVPAAVASTLTAGTLLPWYREVDDEGEERGYSLLTMFGDAGGGDDHVALMVGFAGLLVCTVIAVVMATMAMFGATFGRVGLRTAQVIGVLLSIGALVPAGFTPELMAEDEAGAAMAFYLPGVVLNAVIVFSPFRVWWLATEGT